MVHRRAPADHAVEAETIVQLRPQLRVFMAQPALADAVVQHLCELHQLERLDQEVDGAVLDRLDRLFDAAEAGDHDRPDLGIARQRCLEDVHAVGVGQPQVDDQAVVGEAFEAGHRIGAVQRLGDREPLGFERFRDELTQIGFVLDDEHGALFVLIHRGGEPVKVAFRISRRLPISWTYVLRHSVCDPNCLPGLMCSSSMTTNVCANSSCRIWRRKASP